MDNIQIQKMMDEVYKDTGNRSKGSLKRAIWYGNNNTIIGQNKGLRKAVRNAPKTIAMGGIGAALTGVAPGLSDLISKSADAAMVKCKNLYSGSSVKASFKKPMSYEEGLRKTVKNDLKAKGDEIAKIDRNLVKMKDALHKISPAVQGLMSAAPKMTANSATIAGKPMAGMGVSVTAEKEIEKKAYDAFKSVAEAEYYIMKLIVLMTSTEEGISKMKSDLKKLLDATNKTGHEIEGFVESML